MVYHAHHVIACVSLPFAPIRPIPCVPPFVPSEICTILTDVEAFLAAWIAARRVAKAHEARASMLAASVVGEPCSCDFLPLSGFGSLPFPLGIEAEELGQAFPFKHRDGRDGEPGARGPTWIDPPSDRQKGILKRGAATGVVDASWKPPSNPTADPDSIRIRVPSSGWEISGQNRRFERETTAVPSEARGQHPGARPTSTWPR